MITADSDFVLYTGSKVKFSANRIYVYVNFDIEAASLILEMKVFDQNTITGIPFGSYSLFASSADVGLTQGTGADDPERFASCAQRFVRNYLANIPENSSVNFVVV